MRVIEIITQGPQGAAGPQGPTGPTGSFDTASFATTASFNQFTSSIQTEVTSLTNATNSFVQNSQTSSFKGFSSTTSGTIVTGTNNNTFSKALLIPSNSYKTDDIPEVLIRCRRVSGSTANNTYTTRLYWSITPDISGTPTLLGRGPAVAGGNNTLNMSRNITIINAATTSSVTEVVGGYATDFGTNANGVVTLNPNNVTIDWTQNGYIVVAIQNTGTTGLNDQNYCDLIRVR